MNAVSDTLTRELEKRLRQQFLEIHRSSVIPTAQKSYLVAALGSISSDAPSPPAAWTPPILTEDMSKAELTSALADALALKSYVENPPNVWSRFIKRSLTALKSVVNR